jgi:hypothetical protein
MSYSTKIITALEALWPKNVETQTDLIAQMLSDVPAEEHETVMLDCARYCVLSNRSDHMKNVSWGDEALRADEAKENRFVTMPVGEWEHVKMLAKRQAHFKSWAEWQEWANRINAKRRSVRLPPREVIERDPDFVGMLLEDRLDVIRYPQRHVTSEAEKFALIREYESAIVRRGGKARLDKVIAAEWVACNN